MIKTIYYYLKQYRFFSGGSIMSKEEWKNTGKNLGDAFQGLAKTLIRSAKEGIDKAEDWAGVNDENPEAEGNEGSVFSDGSWRETGKDLGHAFQDLGKSIIKSGSEGIDKAQEWADKEDQD